MTRSNFSCALAVLAALSTAAAAQPMPSMPGMSAAPAAPADAAYKAAMDKMMAGMAAPPTNHPDRDFVAGMIPHHQGAIDMAKVELTYGKDPGLRRLATAIIAAQTREIAFMRDWQAHHPAVK
jgi:uncharacterized protein (DUF305 family)